jgi:hypothetical protein
LVLGGSHTQGALREEWALEWNADLIPVPFISPCRKVLSPTPEREEANDA